jgi:purine-binding chemotaxis protein CheW
MARSQQFCTFYLDRYFFGIEVEKVQEVIRYQDITPVALASRLISGLINLRGQIVTTLDLRRRLGLCDRHAGKLPMNVVVKTDDGTVSLLVDEIANVQEVQEDLFEAPPETLSGVSKELIRGTYKLKDRILLTLNVERALNLTSDAKE